MRRPGSRWLVGVLLLGLLAGCGGDPREEYCEVVEDRQQELTEVVGAGGPDALLRALPIFRELREEAPRDLRDEWRVVVTALEALDVALDEAGVDPATYDRDAPPEGVSQEQRDRIDAASRDLTSATTAEALNGVQQQARDVCKTPLTL